MAFNPNTTGRPPMNHMGGYGQRMQGMHQQRQMPRMAQQGQMQGSAMNGKTFCLELYQERPERVQQMQKLYEATVNNLNDMGILVIDEQGLKRTLYNTLNQASSATSNKELMKMTTGKKRNPSVIREKINEICGLFLGNGLSIPEELFARNPYQEKILSSHEEIDADMRKFREEDAVPLIQNGLKIVKNAARTGASAVNTVGCGVRVGAKIAAGCAIAAGIGISTTAKKFDDFTKRFKNKKPVVVNHAQPVVVNHAQPKPGLYARTKKTIFRSSKNGAAPAA